jgi:hypothetical protein
MALRGKFLQVANFIRILLRRYWAIRCPWRFLALRLDPACTYQQVMHSFLCVSAFLSISEAGFFRKDFAWTIGKFNHDDRAMKKKDYKFSPSSVKLPLLCKR